MIRCGEGTFHAVLQSTDGKSHYLMVNLPNYPSFKNAVLEYSWELRLLLNREKHVLDNIDEFQSTKELLDAVKKLTNKEKISPPRSAKFYATVFEELNKIGNNAELKPCLSRVDFEKTDIAGRSHKSSVSLPFTYPDEPIVLLEHDLPINSSSCLESVPSFSSIETLSQFYHQFCNLINLFQPFWEAMDNFDGNCCVLDPRKPVLSDRYRRIQLTDTCSGLLTFDPYHPTDRPEIEFRGPVDEVAALRNTLESHLLENHWDPDVDIHLNLLYLLHLDNFPSTRETQEESGLVQSGECGICFDDRLDGQPANARCDNALCKSQYHQHCLLRYLITCPDTMRLNKIVMGKCPTCKSSIGCDSRVR